MSQSDSQRKKILQACYGLTAAVVGVVVWTFLDKSVQAYDLEARFRLAAHAVRLVAFLSALATYIILARHKRVQAYMNHVLLELGRVTWPTKDETLKMTYVVIVMVIISSMALGFMDWTLTGLVKKIVSWV